MRNRLLDEGFCEAVDAPGGVGLSEPFTSSEERKRWLPRYLAFYNGRRCQMALAGRTPFQQLNRLRVTE
jgi:hypothetical protein